MREELITKLKENVCLVSFKKKDGTNRKMKCTLKESIVPKATKEDIITIFMALQRQNFALTNTVKQLLKEWPTPQNTTAADPSKYGTLFVIKDSPTTQVMQ